ncbi:hypothetical protein EDC96DRAFT_516593 [Choanephora cucurbitarum]|nr:hypothetical protein EDC96DRAFT_516593 [Choanephora cucurbitarum]
MTKCHLIDTEKDLPCQYEAATRIDFLDFTSESLRLFVQQHCIERGKPLVVSNMHKSNGWKQDIFNIQKLKEYCGDLEIEVDLRKQNTTKKVKLELGGYLEALQQKYDLEGKAPYVYKKPTIPIDNIYAKDVICPDEYGIALKEFLPEFLLPQGNNDLFTFLPDRFKAENLMCYVGQDMTGTPIHRDLCGTMGHNVMTMASEGAFAEWLIVENQYRDELACLIDPEEDDHQRNFRHKGGNRRQARRTVSDSHHVTKSSFMESDRAWLNYDKILKAKFKVQVIVQRKGDLVIIPSRAYHQVRNHGVSVKIAWNRITSQTLTYAFQDQLPLYHIVNRPEVYKCKAIVMFTLKEWNRQLVDLVHDLANQSKWIPILCYGPEFFLESSNQLLDVFLKQVILPELLFDGDDQGIIADAPEEVCTVKCDFCHSDVFCHYYHCDLCDQYDLCLDCYSIGRGCQHIASMQMYKGPESIMNAVKLYLDYVKNINLAFHQEVIPNLSLEVLRNNPSHKFANLATTCRRIERHRRLNPNSFNILHCNHCLATTTVSKLGEQGIGLSSIFKRNKCPNALSQTEEDRVNFYTCLECTKKCNLCMPLEVTRGSLRDYDLVYYLHPSHDERNWGGFIDLDVKKTCDIPQILRKTRNTFNRGRNPNQRSDQKLPKRIRQQ